MNPIETGIPSLDVATARLVAACLTRFRHLQAQWKRDTRLSSSLTARHEHSAYQAIIAMGMPVVPIILDELRRDPDWWFAALMQITGEDPSPPEHAGNLGKQTQDWLTWGEKNGYG